MEKSGFVPRAPRTEIVAPVDLAFGDGHPRIGGISVNLSTTGMLVRSGETTPSGTSVTFGFSLFQGKGEIVWVGRSDQGDALLGMKFVSIERQPREDTGFPGEARPSSPAGRNTGPGFAEVTGHLIRSGVSLSEIAFALGETPAAVRVARLDSAAPDYRGPPGDWRVSLASLARGRGEVLDRIARKLLEGDPYQD